ncbi:MAG: heavy metal translocating P-type ATPase [Spirochaetota bacterium]
MLLAGLETFAITYLVVRVAKRRKQKLSTKPGSGKKLKSDEEKKYSEEKQHNKNIILSTTNVIGTLAFSKFSVLKLLNISLLGYTTHPILEETEKSLVNEKKIKNDFLNSSIIIICVAQGFYFTSALVAAFYYLGSKFIGRTRDLSEKMLHHAFQLPYETAVIICEDNELEIPFHSLKKNDIVVIDSGQPVPVDGEIVEGMALLDQHTLTGEAKYCEKQIGDTVFASTTVVSGKILVRTEKTGHNTSVGKINKILSNTTDFRTQLQLRSQSLVNRTALPILASSAIAYPLLGPISATTLLNSSPGNTLRTWGSLLVINHLVLASRNSILIKDGRTLEELRKVDTILFDKTGTLTENQFELGHIVLTSSFSEMEILKMVASVEQKLSHPIAEAVLLQARKMELSLYPIQNADYHIGFGVEAIVHNFKLLVGSARFMTKNSIVMSPTIANKTKQVESKGHSVLLVAINSEIVAAIELLPKIRKEAFEIIKSLRAMGIDRIAVVSGDTEQPTQNIALQLGLSDYYHNVLPQDKASLVESLQKKGHRICFIGDGINDVVAMKKANVSVSLTGASSIANDVAQVLLLNKGLSHLPSLFEISKSLHSSTNQSISLSFISGIVNVTGALFFGMNILSSAILFNGLTMLFGVFHAQRPLKREKLTPFPRQTHCDSANTN